MRFLPIVLIALAACGADEPVIPGTPAGEVFQSWLAAFNSGDRAKLKEYLAKYEPTRVGTLEQLSGFRERTGGFTVIAIQKSEPLHLEALLKERDGENFAQVTLEITDASSPTVKQLGIRRAPKPADQPDRPRLTFDGAVAALDHDATDLAAKDRFAGALLVARSGKIALEKAYGMADRKSQQPNTTDTKFRIGSMNKMFTATAILQLVAEGKVDLSAPIGKYLVNYPNHEVATKVTIRHLLTHTGGTGDIFTPEYNQHRLETRTLSDYLKLFGARGLEFEPGSQWSYSNYGFVLLGAIVERVSGQTYYDYVRKNIFEKAGMNSTDSLPETEQVTKRSIGYLRKDNGWVSNEDTLPWRASSAGGGYSTVGDLLRFAEALAQGKLVSPSLFSQMTSAQERAPQMPPGGGYGFGMEVSDEPQGKRFGHGGGAPGMNGELRVYPKTGTVVVVLANVDPPAASRLADRFDELMPLD